ncbi:MAG: hypothetical protein MK207_12180 [Saprospiraceae bacterium]|nr:hypothetical protein [Saprospiraceae bacterium]
MSNFFDDLEKDGKASPKPARWKSALSIIAVVVIAFFIFRMFLSVLIPFLIGIILIANRDLVAKAIKLIYNQYKDETWKGLLATVVAVLIFTPFVGFLFLRSLYYLFVDENKHGGIQTKESDASKLINIAMKQEIKDLLDGDDNHQR